MTPARRSSPEPYTRHVQEALFDTPGLSPRERRRAAFWWRNWLNAVAPANFLLTNSVAVRQAIETHGALALLEAQR